VNLPEEWMEWLQLVEIIHGEDEIDLYMQINGNSVKNQFFSPARLEFQISKLNAEDDQLKKGSHKLHVSIFLDPKDSKEEDDQMQEINNQINKLINRIQDIMIDPFYFKKTQDILRNLNVHKSVLKLLTKRESASHQIVIRFLSLFVQHNPTNCRQIMPHYATILALSTEFKVTNNTTPRSRNS
jgi:hypothetical protein